jgi:glutamine synthetase
MKPVFIADVYDASMNPFSADPRTILKKTVAEATHQGYDAIKVSPELEFYVFDKLGQHLDDALGKQRYLAPLPLDPLKDFGNPSQNT